MEDSGVFCAEEARKLSEKAIVGLSVVDVIEKEIKRVAVNGDHSTNIDVTDNNLAEKICWYFCNRGFSITKYRPAFAEEDVKIIISW